VHAQFGIDAKAAGADPGELNHDELADALVKAVSAKYEEKEKQFSPELMRWLERRIILDVVDSQWKDHLLSLDHLKEGIGLRGYGQKDPLVEFKKEAFVLFEDMMARIDNETIRYLFHIQIQQAEKPPDEMNVRPQQPPQSGPPRTGGARAAIASAAARAEDSQPERLPAFAREMERKQQRQQKELQYQTGPAQAEAPKPVRAGAKVGRNDPCPCGSGKKYKKCHGANA
jgi:preprotein translocase subunit SecA